MFNLQPGQGIGFKANKEIAFGLGYDYAVGGSKLRHRYLETYPDLHGQILREDEEILKIIKEMVLSGKLN